jgi:hypothetical protein
MSEAAAQVINTFSTLPRSERYSVLVELARISETDAGAITDEELALTAKRSRSNTRFARRSPTCKRPDAMSLGSKSNRTTLPERLPPKTRRRRGSDLANPLYNFGRNVAAQSAASPSNGGLAGPR